MSSFTKSLLWFRMDLMADLIAQGHEVHALGPDEGPRYAEQFAERGIHYRSFTVSRNGLSPLEDLRTYLQLRRAIREINPDRVFTYQAKTIVYGVPAAWSAGVRHIYPLVAGLGSIFRGTGLKHSAVRVILSAQYRRAFRRSRKVFFQNTDDSSTFVAKGLVRNDQIVMLNGSGVNVDRFHIAPVPGRPSFLFIGRLIRDKGVIEYLEACKSIKALYPGARCVLAGPFDSNPTALQPGDIEPYTAAGFVEYVGELDDVRPLISECSVFVLPSYHEGTPKSVLEAMSMGRAIITTDAPGCRETVVDGVNGILVPVGEVDPLVRAMARFVDESGLSRRMGEVSRTIAEQRFDVHKVNRVVMSAMELTA